MEGVGEIILSNLYVFFYEVGLVFVDICRRFGRLIRRLCSPLTKRRKRLTRWLRYRTRDFRRNLRAAGKDLRSAGKNPFVWLAHLFRLIGRFAKRYRGALVFLWSLLGPLVALAVLIITVSVWSNTRFCLSLTYAGQDLGYIENTDIYDRAAAMARGRVVNVNNSFSVEEVPTVAIALRRDNTLLNEGELCDGILRTAGDSIAEATGLYVDGQFVGAMESAEQLKNTLTSLQRNHYDPQDPDQRAEFVQAVSTVEGLFPAETVVGSEALKAKLTSQAVVQKNYTVQPGDTVIAVALKNNMTTGELRAMNPAIASSDIVFVGQQLVVQRPQSYLQVKMVKTIRYAEEIDFNTQTTYNTAKPVTYSKVKTKGVKGSQDVVAEITYLDGVETGRKVISATVTRQPVTQVLEKGTQKVQSPDGGTISQGDGISHGTMLWPVPICHNMSRGYGRGHGGIDICNGPVTVRNKPALAADGGTVIYAGRYYGYGNYVKIRHANGLVTAYGHLNSISVVNGQQVSRGQQVGLIGSTGQSSGPHLHFEVIKNGSRVNPLNYVKR